MFFPDCSKGEACPFYHPVLCTYWPKCLFGTSCVNFHPKTVPNPIGVSTSTEPVQLYTHIIYIIIIVGSLYYCTLLIQRLERRQLSNANLVLNALALAAHLHIQCPRLMPLQKHLHLVNLAHSALAAPTAPTFILLFQLQP